MCNLVPSHALHECVISFINTNVRSTCKQCDVFEKVMQLSVHDQHDAFVKIRKEFRSRSIYFASCTLWIISSISFSINA